MKTLIQQKSKVAMLYAVIDRVKPFFFKSLSCSYFIYSYIAAVTLCLLVCSPSVPYIYTWALAQITDV